MTATTRRRAGRAAPAHRVHVVPWLRGAGGRVLVPGWLAITIGREIITWRSLDERELAHELEHVRQWRQLGLRFIPRYLRASLRAWRSGGDRYRDNVFEIEARAAAARVGADRHPAVVVPAGHGRPTRLR